MAAIEVSGLVVQPLTLRIEEWLAEGKLVDADLDPVLGGEARALLDHGSTLAHWAPLDVVESLIALVAAQLGGETGLVEWAPSIVEDWLERAPVRELTERARLLVDAPGFLVSETSQRLVRGIDWRYEGGRTEFSVTLEGLAPASPSLRSLLGALLAGLVVRGVDSGLDPRFAGVDSDELVIFAEAGAPDSNDGGGAERRLHRAALVPAD